MIERCEELPLPEETFAPHGTIVAGAQEFNGYLLLNLAIGALGQVHSAHSTGAEQPYQSIRSTRTNFPVEGRAQHLFGCGGYTIGEALNARRIEFEQRFDFGTYGRFNLPFVKNPLAFAGRKARELVEQAAHVLVHRGIRFEIL